MTELEIFAQRLRQARILKKISMDKLVERIGGLVSKQAISKYESAKMKPTSTIMIAIATALDVDVNILCAHSPLMPISFKCLSGRSPIPVPKMLML